jgi:hypothetical protein
MSGRWYLADPSAGGGMGGIIWLGDAIIFIEDNVYRVGSETFRVDYGQNAVLRSFIDAPFLDEAELRQRSHKRDAPRILRRLRLIRGGILQPFIHCPGNRWNVFYRVAIRRECTAVDGS